MGTDSRSGESLLPAASVWPNDILGAPPELERGEDCKTLHPEHGPSLLADEKDESTYGQILRSTALIGGSSIVNILFSVLRTKAMAVLLGPAGFGLMGAFTTIADLMRSVAEMGINNSGVRQIAEAAGSSDMKRIARTVIVVRRTAIILGILGALLLAALSRQIATLTFGNEEHAGAVALLSLAVFFRLVSDGQGALLQGMRRIGDIAKLTVLGSLLGTLVTIPLVYWLRERGVALSLVAVAATSLLLSWWYSRKVTIIRPSMTTAQFTQEAASLLRLGVAFMVSGFLIMGSAYVVRMILIRHGGLDEAGYYQAAWALGGLYLGIVLQSLASDFYPRLTACADDNLECNRLVNEQTQVSLLLAGPGVLGTLTFAQLVISLFYTSEFSGSVDVLRWICIGMAIRVISWPMGFIVLAKNAQKYYFWSEIFWTIVHVGLAWSLVATVGLAGAGMAFFASYVFHVILVFFIVRRLSGFFWTPKTIKFGVLFIISIALVFFGFQLLSHFWALTFGIVATLISSIYSVKTLFDAFDYQNMPKPIRRLLAFFKFSRVTTSMPK